MKLEYSPSADKFYQDDVEISLKEAQKSFVLCGGKGEFNLAMARVVRQFNWDMDKVHDYYGNGK